MAPIVGLEKGYLISLADLQRFLKCPQAFYIVASGQFRHPTREEELAASGVVLPATPEPPQGDEAADRILRWWQLYRARRFGDSRTVDGLHAWNVNGDRSWRFLAYADPNDPLTFRFTVQGSSREVKCPDPTVQNSRRKRARGKRKRPRLVETPRVADVAPFEINYRTLENTGLGIRGRPVAINPADGAMIPGLPGLHFGASSPFSLELAFHWLLMEPYRSKPSPPVGFLLGGRVHDLKLESHIEDVQRLLVEMRQVLRDGVPPRVCSCDICDYKGILRAPILDEIRKQAYENGHVSVLRRIGPAGIKKLEEQGVFTIDQLEEMEASTKSSKKSAKRVHIESYRKNMPIVFGDTPAAADSFIVLDLEYGIINGGYRSIPTASPKGPSFIWIAGLSVVRAGRQPEHHLLWADDAAEERANLNQLAEVMAAEPSLPVFTWNGTTADIRQLKKAVRRFKLGRIFSGVYRRHRDLYKEFDKNVRLPRKKMSVDDVASWFGFQKKGSMPKGVQPLQDTYLGYRLSRGNDPPRAQAFKNKLLEYNRDDLDALAYIVSKIPDLHPQQTSSPGSG